MRITRSGWGVAIGSVALALAGRLLGTIELLLLGCVGLAVLIVALVFVRLRRPSLAVSRQLLPPRVHVGDTSRVDLAVRNQGTTATPVLRLRDPVSATRGANLLVGPLAPGEEARASYRLPTERRGVIDIGPLELVVSDPFGLVESRRKAAPLAHLTVFPVVHRLTRLPRTGGSDPHAGVEHRRSIQRGGEDFYALRPFVIGDELRRVHWASTARHDELMVRQDELPWQGRLTVIVDNDASRIDTEGLDLATSVAASLVQAAHRRDNLVRLVTGDGTQTDFVSGNAQIESIMERLALLQPDGRASLRTALDHSLSRFRHGGAVVITTEPDAAAVATLGRLSSGFGALTTVVIDASALDPAAPEGPAAAGRRIIRITRSTPFPEGWHRAMGPAPVGTGR
jgi:uncharacterized protein (DUF58 family)